MINNEIILGNSIQTIKIFKDNHIDLIVSDIPYGIGYDDWDVLHANTNSAYGKASSSQEKAGKIFQRRGKPLNGWSEADKKIPKEYQEWCSSWASEWLRVLKPGASCFIFAGRRYAHRCICALEDVGFTFKDMLAWEKNTAPFKAQRVSAVYDRRRDTYNANKWAGWRLANPRPIFEPILWFQKPYPVGKTLSDNILCNELGAWNEEAFKKYNLTSEKVKLVSNVIATKVNSFDRGLHDAQKPLNLIKFLIELTTLEDSVVLDPFAGSGTTCVAAKLLGRSYIGIEASEKYYKIALERISNLQL